jgi:hypothetical protein
LARWKSFLAFAVTALMALTAAAQTSDGPCPPPKTVISYSSGDKIEAVRDMGGGVCQFKNVRTARPFERMVGAFLMSDPTVKAHINELRTLVPLQVGKTVQFQKAGADDKGNNVTWLETYSVEKYEKHETPAGPFDAFVILWTEQIQHGTGTWESRWWYSPQTGCVLRFKFRNVQGHPPQKFPSEWYLVSVENK